jgi:hypothetical protein
MTDQSNTARPNPIQPVVAEAAGHTPTKDGKHNPQGPHAAASPETMQGHRGATGQSPQRDNKASTCSSMEKPGRPGMENERDRQQATGPGGQRLVGDADTRKPNATPGSGEDVDSPDASDAPDAHAKPKSSGTTSR